MRSSPPAVRTALLLALCLFAGGCQRQPTRPLERVVVVPFENLTGDPRWDWLGVTLPHLLIRESAGHASLIALAVSDERAATPARAHRTVRGYYTLEGGRAMLRAYLRDLDSVRTLGEAKAELPAASDAGRLAQSLASQLRLAGGQPASPIRGEALVPFGDALVAAEPVRKKELAEEAWKREPRFGAAGILLAQLRDASGDAAGARTVYTEALRQAAGPDEAQLRLSLAALSGNTGEQVEALQAALRVFPAHTDAMRQLAERLLLRRNAPEAVRWLTEAVRLEPGQIDFRNTLAYAHAVAGQFDQALAAAAQYRQIAPDDPNAFDTSGEIAWMGGRFRDAEQFFLEAQAKNPQFLGGLEFSKAAFARFLDGDVAGADQLFQRYLETRRAAKDPYADLREAHWLLLTGRAAAAQPKLRAVSAGTGDPSARARILEALAHLLEGRREAAAQTARPAITQKPAPQTLTSAAMLVFLAAPSAPPAEWTTRVDRAVNPQTPARTRRLLLGYALFLDKHYREAAAALREAFDLTMPAEADESRLLLGRARFELGDKRTAAGLLTIPPLPPQPGEALLAGLYFPQFLNWKKAAR